MDTRETINPRTLPMNQLVSLATELAGIRAAGFGTVRTLDHFCRRLFVLAKNRGLDASELYGRVCGMALEIAQDDARTANATIALDMRRKAV